MPEPAIDDLLHAAVREGIISAKQAGLIGALRGQYGVDQQRPSTTPVAVPAESPRGLNTISVAYALGALLILFAFGWFLFDRWMRLGVWGVLAVVAAYAVVLVGASVWLWRHDYRIAAGLAAMLAVSLTPLLAWDLQTMAGLWPVPNSNDPLLLYPPWMAWRWIVVELSLILVSLLVIRRYPFVALTWPIAVALWALSYHLGELLREEWFTLGYERWIRVAAGLAILATADFVQRWQERTRRAGGSTEGDYATAFWFTGMLSFSVAYLILWSHADRWRHLLPVVALAFLAMSLYLRRRVILAFGMLGVFGYLGFLAEDVFRDIVSFPLLLAALGVVMIAATVWAQRSFPALVERVGARRGGAGRGLPWSPAMSLLPPLAAVAMALISIGDVAEERAQQDFRQRLYILRMHSGSISVTGRTRSPKGGPPTPAPARNDETHSIPR